MTYPPAPWYLYGNALVSFHLIDVEKARPLVPGDFEIVSVLPGKTFGALYLSVYEANSTLQYHELIVGAALVRYGNQIGTWISHIYVDDSDSLAGGRNIWGLPKEMAEFSWGDRTVSVMQGSRSLCQVDYGPAGLPLSLWGKSKISGDVFSGLDQDILLFTGNFEAQLRWVQCNLMIPPESPFTALHLGHPWLTIQMHDLAFTANAPTIVGQSSRP
ncbi:hypothetical protein DO97_13875 [Neosynechococcus sphagnicola sy1]|uniref:Acetoacetate decarboxylase n=2 Tax=Neosynechococcus TaxID=1501143 RepID=A0A098TIR1_9CYAN|nr:hypothetical protein DO97_13875 [Neosynechococcus sphagnicola sy1]